MKKWSVAYVRRARAGKRRGRLDSALPQPHFLEPLLRAGHRKAGLLIERSGRQFTLADCLEAAVDSASRKRGLLGRDSLAPGSALVIAPSSGVHTFFMKFAIDIVFVKRDGLVLKIARAVKPWRGAVALAAFAVVELAEGSADRAGLLVGDRLVVRTEP